MKKAIAIIVSVLFVLSVAGLSFAAEKKEAAPAEKKMEKKAPAKVKQVTGEVTAVDAKAMTLTVKGKKGDVALTADDKTAVMAGKEKKALGDVKVGDKVMVKYTETDGKMVAKNVSIAPAKKEKKEMKKEMKKEAPAEKPAAAPAEKKKAPGY